MTDRDAIIEVRHRFGLALDTRDWALLSSLLTDEVDADYSAWGVPAQRMTRQALVELMQAAFRRADMRSQQLYGNFLVTIRGDEAECDSMLLGLHHLPGQPGGSDFALHARYRDRLRRDAGGWRLAGVKLEVLFTTGNAAVLQ